MRKSKQRLDKITVGDAEIADSHYAIFLHRTEQLSSWTMKKEYLVNHLSAITRITAVLEQKLGLDEADRTAAAGAFFAVWYFGHVCLSERYIDDSLNECFRLLLPSTCISYVALLEDITKAHTALVAIIENCEALQAPKKLKITTATTHTPNNIEDLF
jgi:hypothetical protein